MSVYFKLVTLSLFVLFAENALSQVGIGTTVPASSAKLDVTSTTRGFLPPRLTYAQKIAIVSPVAGLQVWCKDCGSYGELQVYNGTTWTNMIGEAASAAVPDAPTSLLATAGNAQVSVAFTASVSNGGSTITGYTVTSSPGSVTATGTSSPIVVAGLTNGTSYTFTMFATNAVGNSVTSVVSAAVTPAVPFVCGTSTVTFTYNGSTVNYGTVSRAYGGTTGTKCWLDRNLGASQVATGHSDALSYGDLFQWGRLADGHQIRTSATTGTLSSTDVPGNANFILSPNAPNNWRSSTNNNLWQGVNGINNPCPSGFRLPSSQELDAERAVWSSNNHIGAFASPLKWSIGGRRNFSTGIIGNISLFGFYWSSTNSSTTPANSKYLVIEGGSSVSSTIGEDNRRAFGGSIRCIKD